MAKPITVIKERQTGQGSVAYETATHVLAPCMFCGTRTAWKRPSPTHADNTVCFDCIPKMTQLWQFAGLTEPKGD